MSHDTVSLPSYVSRYLKKYSSGKWVPEWNYTPGISAVVVVPVLKEYENLPGLLISLSDNSPGAFAETLILFVINNAESASPEIRENNLKTLKFLRGIQKKETSDDISARLISSGIQIGIIDASSPGLELPDKDAGVGMARKTGMDAALTIFNYSLNTKKIIVCLDADCTVGKNYLTEVIDSFKRNNLPAADINFAHNISDENENTEAIICYEIFLRYYVLGLHYAGSPYAFHTIGSSMACDHQMYIKIEGMNKRKAAEDFYFMEKLAKASLAPDENSSISFRTGILQVNSTTVYPSARASWRVPFGTGQRINRFLSHERNEYLLFDPQSFEILKKWLNLFASNEDNNADFFLNRSREIHGELFNFLAAQRFKEDWQKIEAGSKSPGQIAKQKILWFDGFRTMKLLHYLRDTVFPEINMFDALDKFFALSGFPSPGINRSITVPAIDIQKEYLLHLRKIEMELHK